MKIFFIRNGKFFPAYFMVGILLFLQGCAGYKAQPLDDFTDKKTSHLDKELSDHRS